MVFTVLAVLHGPTAPAQGTDAPDGVPAYLAELRRRAAALGLARQPRWLRLLHMQPDAWGGGYTSQADGAGFFLAPDGKINPAAELDAALAAFFTETILPPGRMTAQCTFPARYRWLKEQLGFDPARLPEQPCERFDAWRAALDPESVTLIFASYYLNNPSSIFGHTLLRFDRRGRPDSQRLLDYAVNYAAAVPAEDGAIVFAWRGIFGGYAGYFSVLPYYQKVREYSDLESRDLWEYRLNLSPDQLDWLLRHTWEMGSTSFDYFFFGENCSYHLLSLLEAADPSLRLLERFPRWTLPTDTVRVVAGQPGLVAGRTYRPSRGSRIIQKLETQSAGERALSAALARGTLKVENPALQDLPADRRALVLDTAIDYRQYRLAGEEHPPFEERSALRALLLARSTLGTPYDPEAFPRRSEPPETGHHSSRLTAAVGAGTDRTSYLELSGYGAFHDLLSREDGYAANTQLLLGDIHARAESRDGALRLERAALVDIVSLLPMTVLLRQPSWQVAAGWQRNRDLDCGYCVPFFLRAGIGLAAATRLAIREVWFAFLDGAGEFDRAFKADHRAGFGVTAGLLLDLTPAWRAALTGSRTAYTTGDAAAVSRWSLRQRYSLGKDWELRLDWNGTENYREAQLAVGWFF